MHVEVFLGLRECRLFVFFFLFEHTGGQGGGGLAFVFCLSHLVLGPSKNEKYLASFWLG